MSRRLLATVTLVVALATAAVLAVLPTYRGESCAGSAVGATVCTSTSATLLEHEGRSVLLVLLVPALLALVGVVAPHRMVLRGIAIVLTVLTILGAMSIGLFFVPTLLSAWVAAERVSRSPRTPRHPPRTAPAA